MILKATTDLLRLITSAAGEVETIVEVADLVAPDTVTVERVVTNIAGATTTTIAAGVASTSRKIKHATIRNTHASTTNTVTVTYSDNGTLYDEFKVTLLAGEEAEYAEGYGWKVFDVNGAIKMSAQVPAASDTVAGVQQNATQAEMETGSSITDTVTPGRQHFHPGHPKAWLKCGVTANVLASFNITSLTDTGPGLVAVTIATDFSSVHYNAQVAIERASTALTVTNLLMCAIRNATLAAGTLTLECWDGTAATAVQEDPVSWHFVAHGDH